MLSRKLGVSETSSDTKEIAVIQIRIERLKRAGHEHVTCTKVGQLLKKCTTLHFSQQSQTGKVHLRRGDNGRPSKVARGRPSQNPGHDAKQRPQEAPTFNDGDGAPRNPDVKL